VGSEGTGERLDGRSVRPFLSEVPPFQRAQGTPDRRPASLGLRHRPAHTDTTAKPLPRCQANINQRRNRATLQVEGFLTFSRGFRRQRGQEEAARPVASVLGKGGSVLRASLETD